MSEVVQVDKNRNAALPIASVFLLAAILAIGIYLAIKFEFLETVTSFINESMPPVLFIAMMVILPMAGLSIGIFLVVGGIKFGMWQFFLLWMLVLPVHVLAGYYLARLVRKPLKHFLSNKMGYRIPQIPENGVAQFSFMFLAFPGIPYAVKNYILPLAGVPFPYCIFMNYIVQGTLGIPFILLGRSAANIDLTLFYVTLAIIVAIYLILWRLRGNTQV